MPGYIAWSCGTRRALPSVAMRFLPCMTSRGWLAALISKAADSASHFRLTKASPLRWKRPQTSPPGQLSALPIRQQTGPWSCTIRPHFHSGFTASTFTEARVSKKADVLKSGSQQSYPYCVRYARGGRGRESGRGQPHPKIRRSPVALGNARSVLECGCPLPLCFNHARGEFTDFSADRSSARQRLVPQSGISRLKRKASW